MGLGVTADSMSEGRKKERKGKKRTGVAERRDEADPMEGNGPAGHPWESGGHRRFLVKLPTVTPRFSPGSGRVQSCGRWVELSLPSPPPPAAQRCSHAF